MKRITLFLLALGSSQLAHAAPTPKVKAPQNRTNAAVALLDKSARSYAKLKGLSMRFNDVSQRDGKTTQGSGTIVFARPAQAKAEFKTAARTFIAVSDGKKVRMSRDPKIYETSEIGDDDPIQVVIGNTPAGLGLPLALLTAGENELLDDSLFMWEKVDLLPDNGVVMKSRPNPSDPTLEFRLFFDPKNALLRRVETRQSYRGNESLSVSTISEVQINPKFSANTFVFTPPQGAKEEIQLPFYDPKLKVGTVPYALTGTALDGQPRSIDGYRGKVVLLDFWATWCGPCIEEIPNVLSNYRKYHARGFEVLGVSLDEDKKALTDFVTARKLPWPQMFDGKGWKSDNATRYGVRAIPFTLLIGRDGKIAAVNPSGEELEEAIQKALNAKH